MTTQRDTEGSKYEVTKSLDIAAIAKLVREDIKSAIKSGALPTGIKCSVTISRYSGGQSLRVSVTAFPGQIVTEEFIKSDPNKYFSGERRTAAVRDAVAKLEEIRRSYNYDNSDPMVDHFDVRYYGSTDVCWKLEKADRERTIARKVVETRITAEAAQENILKAQARLDAALARKAELEAEIERHQLAIATNTAEMAALVGCHEGAA